MPLSKAMPARAASVRLAVLLAALLFPVAALGETPFTSVQGGYSVSFPAEPRETVQAQPEGRIVSYLVREEDAVYGTSHVDYSSDIDVEQELQANAMNFAGALRAPLTSRHRAEFSSSGAKLPELEFTYENDRVTGKGFVIVSGRRSILVTAFALKPNHHRAEIDGFLQSFKLTPQQ